VKEPEREETKLREVYQNYLRRELRQPEIRLAKKEFLNTYFPKETPVWLRPQVLAPTLALLVILLIITYYHPSEIPVSPGPELAPARVEVRRVGSGVGPTLVYQKVYQDVPVTIVWVFTGGNPQ